MLVHLVQRLGLRAARDCLLLRAFPPMRPCGHVLLFSNDYLRCLALLPSCTCRGGRTARIHLGNRRCSAISSRPCRLSPVQGSCRSTLKTQSAPVANTSALQSSRDNIITFAAPAAAESTAAPPSVSSVSPGSPLNQFGLVCHT